MRDTRHATRDTRHATRDTRHATRDTRHATRDTPPPKVISGVCGEGSLSAIDHALAAKEAGADGILLMPPHHWLRFGRSNHTETTWASMVCQAKEMIAVAKKHNVIVRVAENFFRMPVDRFAQTVRDSGYLGRIGRILSYADHTGYHNDSRWIAYARCHPEWVQCVDHTMAHPAFYSQPQRRHEKETLTARFFHFPNDLLVLDIGSGHVKGHLGRHPRRGYTEFQGERGTLVIRVPGPHWGDLPDHSA